MGKRFVLLLVREDKSPAHAIGCFATEKDASRWADMVLHLKRTQFLVVPYMSAPEINCG